MSKFKITQIRSGINRSKKEKRTLIAMGLGKINRSVNLELTSPIKGMVKRVNHLVIIKKLSL